MPRTMLSQRKTLPTNSACCQLQALEVAAAACSRRDMTPRPTSGSTAGQQSNQLQCSISIQWGFALIDCPTGACAAVSSRQAQRGSQQPRPLTDAQPHALHALDEALVAHRHAATPPVAPLHRQAHAPLALQPAHDLQAAKSARQTRKTLRVLSKLAD